MRFHWQLYHHHHLPSLDLLGDHRNNDLRMSGKQRQKTCVCPIHQPQVGMMGLVGGLLQTHTSRAACRPSSCVSGFPSPAHLSLVCGVSIPHVALLWEAG